MSLTHHHHTTDNTKDLVNKWLENDIKFQYHVDKCSLKHIITQEPNNNNSNIKHLMNSIRPFKRKRGNNRAPVDIVIKRQRNTDAARRSRLRKAVKMESLESCVDTLKNTNDRLRVQVAVLETEVSHVADKEKRNRQRVSELEALLAIAHKQLVERSA